MEKNKRAAESRGESTDVLFPDMAELKEIENLKEDEPEALEALEKSLVPGDPVRMYLKEIGRFRPLTPDENRACAKKAAEGDMEAKRKLTEANLGLVVSVAKRYSGHGLTLLELIQEGNLGLVKAIEK